MKKKFSTKWVASSQPRKQRKYLANAPLHKKRKMISVNLSKDLRKKYETRNITPRKGDKVKVMRGKHKKKQGKILEIKTKQMKIYIEGIQVKKLDGSKVNVPFRASNLQILEVNTDDARRFKTTKVKPKEKVEKIKTKPKEEDKNKK